MQSKAKNAKQSKAKPKFFDIEHNMLEGLAEKINGQDSWHSQVQLQHLGLLLH